MKTRWKILCPLVFALLALRCHGEGGVDINIDVSEQEVDIKLPSLQNPCELHSCRDDQTCTVVYHPGFLDVPVAHCVLRDQPQATTEEIDPTTCTEIKVGSNVLNCKTFEEWTSVGRIQCALKARQDTPLNLTNTKVAYTCHNFDGSSKSVYLQAQFTCCPRLPDPTPLDGEDSNAQPHAQTEVPTDDVIANDDDLYDRRLIMYPLIVAVATIMALLMILMAVRVRRRRASNLSKPFIATSFVNPSVDQEDPPTYDIMDEYNGRSDKCLLVINEHAQYNPEAK